MLLAMSVTLFFLKEKEEKLRIFLQEQLTKTIEEKNIIHAELITTMKEKEIIQEELTKEQEKSLVLENQLKEKEQQIKLTSDRLEKEISIRQQTESQLLVAMEEMRILEGKVKELKGVARPIELEKIVIKAGAQFVGKILSVHKEPTFIIVNLGSVNNLKVGSVLSVYRKDALIGKVRVERVREEICAAFILPDWQNVQFQEGDEVRAI